MTRCPGDDLFALMVYAMNQFIWAEQNGYRPVVDFGQHCRDGRLNRSRSGRLDGLRGEHRSASLARGFFLREMLFAAQCFLRLRASQLFVLFDSP